MGGTYDVTNVVEDPLVSVITSISIDHTAFLGSTIRGDRGAQGGDHKVGVILWYMTDSSPEAAAVISAKAEELGVQKFPVTPDDGRSRDPNPSRGYGG